MHKLLRLAPVAFLLLGCSGDVQPPKPQHRARLQEQAPQVQRFPVAGGEILVIDVVSRDIRGMLESQRCYVWRDQNSTSALQCISDDNGFPVGKATSDSPNP